MGKDKSRRLVRRLLQQDRETLAGGGEYILDVRRPQLIVLNEVMCESIVLSMFAQRLSCPTVCNPMGCSP